MVEKSNLALMLSVIAIVAVISLALGLFDMIKITGFAQKTDNTPCARNCTMVCTPNAEFPAYGSDTLSVNQCISQCLQVKCNQAVKSGFCSSVAPADECCNIFAEPGEDPDCA